MALKITVFSVPPSAIPTGQDRVYLLSPLSSGPELLSSTLKMEAEFSLADSATCGHNRKDQNLLNDVTFCSISGSLHQAGFVFQFPILCDYLRLTGMAN
jgi:hypothetical protein